MGNPNTSLAVVKKNAVFSPVGGALDKSTMGSDVLLYSKMFNNTDTYPPYAADCDNQPGIISYIARTSINTPFDQLFGHDAIMAWQSTEGILLSVKTSNNLYNAQYVFVNGKLDGKYIYTRSKISNSSDNVNPYSEWVAII